MAAAAPDEIRIVDSDPSWPSRFEEAAARIREAGRERLLAVHHVGSTSVPGLAAKPVIDIQAEVPSIADAEALVPAMTALGYVHDPKWEHEIPGRRYFVRRGADGVRTHHLHVVVRGFWLGVEQVLFRDLLRNDAGLAARYEALKRSLAAAHGADRDRYTQAKGEFIGDSLEAARRSSPPGAPRGHAIVVGGSGMLRAASLGLAQRGFDVSVAARGAERLARMAEEAAAAGRTLVPVVVDYADTAALRRALASACATSGPPALAVLWIHESGRAAKPVVADAMSAAGRRTRVIDVLGSASADPSRPARGPSPFGACPRIALHEVILGFAVERGRSRWLTDEEISVGVLAAVDSNGSGPPRSVVGVTEPWSARP